ncbi:GyrI-like domain-containing protein [Gorillibacterium sp. CAU 1737]|uniref:AraC family transcriptional regulator n=1 Tax=Gorillibacterium sp. CAU 1737 TaxID=3140362 RepID=UPI0032606336
MEWIERFNDSLVYLEENLVKEIDYEGAAAIACCSVYHYQRMFTCLAGVPLSEYLRRRRMTLAAFDLVTGEEKIVDLALKYGYESPTAFNRAFKSVHGVAPSLARSEGISLTSYPPLRFTLTVKGVADMQYRMEKKEAFRIVGIKKRMNLQVEENLVQIPQLWQEAGQNGSIPAIASLINQPPFGLLGASIPVGKTELDYYLAAPTNQPVPEGMSETLIPSATWAVFECIGPLPHAMQELQKRIITEWLPSSGFEYADAPDLELYAPGDSSAPDYRTEVWLPVIPKSK